MILKTLETSTHLHQVNIPERSSLLRYGLEDFKGMSWLHCELGSTADYR